MHTAFCSLAIHCGVFTTKVVVKSFIYVCYTKDVVSYPLITTISHTITIVTTISINIANVTTGVSITLNNTTRVLCLSSSIG
jgi:hypothetical protein